MKPTTPCYFCKGKGHIAMPKKLLATYQAISRSRKPISIPELHKRSKAGDIQTAENKRVNRLIELNLVKDVHEGKGVRRFRVVGNGD